MDDLVAFLRARLDDTEAAVIRYRDGHEGPCLNFKGQPPDAYSEYDSCALHLEAAEATPYRDATFGLADIESKRQTVDWHRKPTQVEFSNGTYRTVGCRCYDGWPCSTLRLLALPFADHPGYKPKWRP